MITQSHKYLWIRWSIGSAMMRLLLCEGAGMPICSAQVSDSVTFWWMYCNEWPGSNGEQDAIVLEVSTSTPIIEAKFPFLYTNPRGTMGTH